MVATILGCNKLIDFCQFCSLLYSHTGWNYSRRRRSDHVASDDAVLRTFCSLLLKARFKKLAILHHRIYWSLLSFISI